MVTRLASTSSISGWFACTSGCANGFPLQTTRTRALDRSVQPSRAVVVFDLPPTPVPDLAPASCTGSRTIEILREDVRASAAEQTNPHHDVVRLELIGDRLARGGDRADEKEPPESLGHERPFPGIERNEASFAQAPHCASSSFVTQPLRTARRSSSRSVVSSISGPSVLKEKRTLCFLKAAMNSPSCSASLTTFVSRFDDGQISRRIPRSASRLHTAASSAACTPWPIRSGSR